MAASIRHSPPLPGLIAVLLLALAASQLSAFPWLSQRGIGALTVAIVLGIVAGNTVYPRWEASCAAGTAFAKHWLLRAGIILYGLRLTLQDIAGVGVAGVVLDALIVTSTFLLAIWLGQKWLGLERNQAWLIGSGSAICGAAAVLATAPLLRARDDQVAVAVATVVVFGTLGMFVYPLFWQWGLSTGSLPLDAAGYGIYTGATVHEVAQVVAAGRAIGPETADTAVITKMVRVMMLAPFLMLVSLRQARNTPGSGVVVPWFAFGFLAVVAFNSLQWLPEGMVNLLVELDGLLLAMAMVALGLGTRFSLLRAAGLRPLLLAAVLFIWLMAGGYALTVFSLWLL